MTIAQHCIQVDFTSTFCLLACLTCQSRQSIWPVWSALIEFRHIWLTFIVMTCCSIQTETTRELQVLDDVPIQLQLAIETLLLILIFIVVQKVVWVGYTVWSIVITWSIEWIIQILKLSDADVARSLHDTVVHRTSLLTGAYEIILLVSIVGRHAQSYVLDLVTSTT